VLLFTTILLLIASDCSLSFQYAVTIEFYTLSLHDALPISNISFNFCLPFEANIVNSCVKQATNSNRLNLGMSLSYEQDLPPPAYRAKLENSSLEMSR